MSDFKKIPNRSDYYQAVLLEISTPHELLDIFPDSDSVYKKLNPFSYNDEIAELQEQLNKELWRIIEDNLTERQKQVVKLYASGKTQIEIAKILGVNQSSITKCIAADTLLHFTDRRLSIYDIWSTWQSNPAYIQELKILSLDEDTRQIVPTSIVDVFNNGVRQLLSVTTTSGCKIRATADHKFFTDKGWMRLEEVVKNKSKLTIHVDGGVRFEDIEKYVEDGEEVTYDIQVESKYHNFMANNVIISNCLHGNVDYKNKDSKGKPITYGGVKLKLQKIVKEDKIVNEILTKIADLRDGDPF